MNLLSNNPSNTTKEYGQFYKYMPKTQSPERPKFKQTGRIATEAEMKERIESKLIKTLQTNKEKQKLGGLDFPKNKVYAIDKIVRKKLQERSGEANYSDLVDPLVNEKYNVLGLGPGPDEIEEPSENIGKEEESKGVEPSYNNNNEMNKDVSGGAPGETVEEQVEPEEGKSRQMTYEEWLFRKEAEARYWKLVIETEKEEQRRIEEEKEREKCEIEEQKKKVIEEWHRRKEEEARIRKIIEEQKREEEELEKEKKRQEGELCYQNWLEQSVMKMQQERELKLAEKIAKMEEEENKRRKKELKKKEAEKSYQDWLKKKNEEKRIKDLIKQEEEKERQKSMKIFNKSDYDVQKVLRDTLGIMPKKKKKKGKKNRRKNRTLKPLEENVEEIKGEGEDIEMEQIRQFEIHSKPKGAKENTKKKINPIIEEKGKEHSKLKDAEDANIRIEEVQDEEEKVEMKVKKAVGKKRKGKKNEPPAEQIFEEISSIQRDSQRAIEGIEGEGDEEENSVESGILNVDDNIGKNKHNISL